MRYRMIRMLTAVTISAILLAGCASSAPSAAAGSETGGAEAADASTAGDTPVDEAVTEAQEDSDTAATGNTAAAEEEEEENYETGDAGLDNPRNQDEIGDKELLVVSFGTSAGPLLPTSLLSMWHSGMVYRSITWKLPCREQLIIR